MSSNSKERLCILCNTENTVKEKSIGWFREGPQPKILECSACKKAWYEWKEPNGFTIIMGASDYEDLYKKLRPDFTPLELLSGFLIGDRMLVSLIGRWYGSEAAQILAVLEQWVRFNMARQIMS